MQLACPLQDVKMVAWHPTGEVLISCSYDDSIKVWVDCDGEWECAQTLAGPGLGHSSTVWGIAFNKDGSQMVSCSDDHTLRVWACSFNNPGNAFMPMTQPVVSNFIALTTGLHGLDIVILIALLPNSAILKVCSCMAQMGSIN